MINLAFILIISLCYCVAQPPINYNCPEGFTQIQAGSMGVCVVSPELPSTPYAPFCDIQNVLNGHYVGFSYVMDGSENSTNYKCPPYSTQIQAAINGYGLGYCFYDNLTFPTSSQVSSVWELCYYLVNSGFLGFGYNYYE